MSNSGSALSLLRVPPFRYLLPSIELCFLGFFVHIVACSWIMAELTESATMVALVQTVATLPPVLFSVVAGGLADVLDRRLVMIVAQVSMFGISLVLFAMSAMSLLNPFSLLLLAFLVTSGNAALLPAWMSALGDIAPRNQLPEAVSLHTISANLMKMIGPIVGGMILITVGPAATFAFGSLSYLPAIVALVLWRPDPRTESPGASVSKAITDGVRFLVTSRQLHPIVQRAFLFGFSANGVIALLPLLARNQYGGAAHVYGMLFGGFGMGAILGGSLMSRLRNTFGIDRVVTGAMATNALAILTLALSSSASIGLIASVVAGACWLIVLTLLNSTLQLAAPRRLVGRMVSAYLTFVNLGFALGSWVWGVLADRFATSGALSMSAGLMGVGVLIALWWRLPDVPKLEE